MMKAKTQNEKKGSSNKPLGSQPTFKEIHLFYDNADLLQIFNISPSTLRRYRLNGYFKFFKIGGKYFYPINEIKRLAETGMPPKKAM